MTHNSKPITQNSTLTEAQDYESIGQPAPEAEAAFSSQKGWDGLNGKPPAAEQPIHQLEGQDFSRWNMRANRQTLAVTDDSSFAEDFFAPVNHPADIPPMTGYEQIPTAATQPVPFDVYDSGVINGAKASSETSGNTGTL